LAVGAPQEFRLLVRNEDRSKLDGIILRLDMPAGVAVQPQSASHGRMEVEQTADGATLLTWSFENLEGGQEAAVPIIVVAEQPRSFAVALEWTFMPMASQASLAVVAPRLELALEGPTEVTFNEPTVYRLHVRNQGDAEARDVAVKLTAEQFGASATQIGHIPPKGSQSLDVELVFHEPGLMNIAAEASTAGSVSAATVVNVQVRQSRLEALLDAPGLVYHGAPTPYVLSIRNSGDAIAKQVRGVVTIPHGALVDTLPRGVVQEGNSLVWAAGDLRPGTTAEVAFGLRLNHEGDNQVVARFDSKSSSSIEAEAVTAVKAVTDLKLLVIDPVAPAPVQGEVVYELQLANRGSKAAQEVSVVALFSKDIEPTRAEGHRAQLMTGQVRFQPIARIDPGQTVVLKVYAKAEAAGSHRFRAEVLTAEDGVKLVQEETTQYMDTIRRTAKGTSGSIIR
jgi:hypothetical protein